MNEKYYGLNIQHLVFQRNAFLALSLALSIVVIVLSVSLSLRKERLVVVPHSINETVWISGNRVSESFLRQQANVVSSLLLNKTLSSSKQQAESLLEITHPSLYGHLRNKLAEEQKLLNEGVSYVFVPLEIKVNEEAMSVETIGDLHTYISKKEHVVSREKYTYKFSFNGQVLLLSEIQREEKKGV